ncbi:MAG: hypothetical protein GF329_17215 [Candidatus Lokiarchaeota archaeon]|nr:hypothetical protein [Candidatus Lokiarchaeota archaeon]
MEDDISTVLLRVLAKVASEVVGLFDINTLLNQIIKTTMNTLHAEVSSIFLDDKKEVGIVKCVAGSGFAEPLVGKAVYKLGEGFTGAIAKWGGEYNIRSLDELQNIKINGKKRWVGKNDKLQWQTKDKNAFRNGIFMALKLKGRIIGVYKAENKIQEYGDEFTDQDMKIFKTIGNVIALTIENARLHQQIEEQLKSIAAKAAHRINNHITNYDYIEIELEKEAQSLNPNSENLKELSETLSKTTLALKRMISDFKRYGKPLKLTKTINDINEIISKEIWHAKPPENLKINQDLDQNIPKFKFDAQFFAESIKELIRNAKKIIIKENGEGNIWITSELILNPLDNKKYAKITIKDDGPGIKPGFPVFEPFKTTDPNSTGLGLATVKEIVRLHGGTIKYKGKKTDQGACFEISLPIENGE